MSSNQTNSLDSSKTLKKVSRKHQEFIEHYLTHFNASKAYGDVFGVPAGHNRDATASAILRRNEVQQYLQQRLAERKATLNVDTQYVVRKLTEVIETDLVSSTAYLSRDQLDKMPEATRKLVQSVELVKTRNSSHTNSGDYENETEKFKVTFMSKDNAITLLGKHTGAFIKDNVSANVNLDQMTFTDALKKLDI